MVIPATAFFSCFLASYCYQDLVNTSMYVLSMHGSWGTITILFAYKKYRQRIFSMLSNMTGRTTCRGNEANSRLSSKVGWAETN
ncbi:hypothetical protein Q1695_009726 [Nippostrongylus brasiliensis]|nr:hypothetical protein Q1695_009726 [Nippostrongylus brasiliensis]